MLTSAGAKLLDFGGETSHLFEVGVTPTAAFETIATH